MRTKKKFNSKGLTSRQRKKLTRLWLYCFTLGPNQELSLWSVPCNLVRKENKDVNEKSSVPLNNDIGDFLFPSEFSTFVVLLEILRIHVGQTETEFSLTHQSEPDNETGPTKTARCIKQEILKENTAHLANSIQIWATMNWKSMPQTINCIPVGRAKLLVKQPDNLGTIYTSNQITEQCFWTSSSAVCTQMQCAKEGYIQVEMRSATVFHCTHYHPINQVSLEMRKARKQNSC